MKRFIIALALLSPLIAFAQTWPRVEVSAGAAHYSKPEDTFWYQEGMPYSMRLTTPALGVALAGDVYTASRWGIGYRVGYTWFGTMRSDATVVADHDYDEAAQRCARNCGQTAKFVSSGHAQTLYLALAPYVRYGKWTLGVEAGPAWFLNTWSINVAGDFTGNQRLAHEPAWRLGYMLGASVGYGEHLSVAYQYFKDRASATDPVPFMWRSLHLVSLRYRF